MAITQVVNWPGTREMVFPVSGAGANVPVGTILMRGVTAGTNKGVLIPATAASNAHGVGILAELHNFAASGDATTATLVQWFPLAGVAGGSTLLGATVQAGIYPSHPVDLFDTATVIQVDYSLVSTVAVASAATVTLTITSFEADYDSGFIYVNAGTGIGQIFNVASSSSGSCVLQTTPTVEPDNTSKLTKVMPLFLDTPVWKINSTTAGTLLDSTAAAGTGRAVNLANWIMKNGQISRLDPKLHNNTSGYNSLAQFSLFSQLALVDTVFHPVA